MKRGQMEISFGVIFSIIIIIAIIGVGSYIIVHFMRVSNCTKVGLFYNSLQKEVDKAWNSDFYEGNFTGMINSGVKSVCFGNLSQSSSDERYDIVRRYANKDSNTFLYPEVSCTGGLNDYKLKNVDIIGFDCFNVVDNKVSIGIEKGSGERLARIVK